MAKREDNWKVDSDTGSLKNVYTQIELGHPEILQDRAGKFVSFTFQFRVGTRQFSLQHRYSALLKFNEKLLSELTFRPKFPAKTYFTDMTRPKNYNKRAGELLNYFQDLIPHPKFLRWRPFHKICNLKDHEIREVLKVAENIEAREDLLRNKKSSDIIICSPRKPDKPDIPGDNEPGDPWQLWVEYLEQELSQLALSAEQNFLPLKKTLFDVDADPHDSEDKDLVLKYKTIMDKKSDLIPFTAPKIEMSKEADLTHFEKEIDKILGNFDDIVVTLDSYVDRIEKEEPEPSTTAAKIP